MLARPGFELLLGVPGHRLGVTPVVDRVVEHRFDPFIGLENANQLVGLNAVREHRDQAFEAELAHGADRVENLFCVQRRLAAVEAQVAVLGHGANGLLEHRPRVGLVPPVG